MTFSPVDRAAGRPAERRSLADRNRVKGGDDLSLTGMPSPAAELEAIDSRRSEGCAVADGRRDAEYVQVGRRVRHEPILRCRPGTGQGHVGGRSFEEQVLDL